MRERSALMICSTSYSYGLTLPYVLKYSISSPAYLEPVSASWDSIEIADLPSFIARIIAAHSRVKIGNDESEIMSFKNLVAFGNDEMIASTD